MDFHGFEARPHCRRISFRFIVADRLRAFPQFVFCAVSRHARNIISGTDFSSPTMTPVAPGQSTESVTRRSRTEKWFCGFFVPPGKTGIFSSPVAVRNIRPEVISGKVNHGRLQGWRWCLGACRLAARITTESAVRPDIFQSRRKRPASPDCHRPGIFLQNEIHRDGLP